MRISESSDVQAWRRTVREFVDEEFGVEYFRKKYQNREYPHELYDAVVDRGWLGLLIPEAYGGEGAGHVKHVVLLEELGTYGYDFGIPVLLSGSVAENIVRNGTDEQIERMVPPLLDGKRRFTVGVTEPDGGSDAASLQTRAERDDGTYIVNGEKTYQSAVVSQDTVVNLYVRTDPGGSKYEGISTLLVPTELEGVTVEELPFVTRKAAGTSRLQFDDVVVPATNLVGDSGDGWQMMNEHLVTEHTHMAAVMVGNARTAVQTALSHATEHERFGQPIAEFQTIKHRLADLQTEVEAARLLVYRAASKLDEGDRSRRLAAQAKLKAGEVLQEVTQEGMQILGGQGFLSENDMERYWREGKSATIAGGTSEIQRSVIAASLLDQ
ncbi:acyl-CoA dehydrogenase family protein [Natrinema halophilum]|uniref:acyl-CoA dehydrogenase family protein n=1 Tax=Natrinema halophilum TaxID=1699371 RepID=UPI001F26F2A3|nr:acyl-CoA dehydrogenase family protein [Natrinema halophilum]UHQ96280.1 acyl-CoA/acyl-ACP dehydrogenase [Natrinema halophilum]